MHSVATITPEEAAFFLNVAVIGATLLGITFVVLSFFLVDLLKRYEDSGLPVFRHQERNETAATRAYLRPPHNLTDYELFDSDPFVVFIAFSVSVTWNLFLLPLVIGLTAAWGQARISALGAEMLVFFLIIAYSLHVRNQKIVLLRPYLTREERAWPMIGVVLLILYAAATAQVLDVAVADAVQQPPRLRVATYVGMTDVALAVFLLKTTCLASLLLGTYTTNKDMFIFFKTTAAERMRRRWLHGFLARSYKDLGARIHAMAERLPDQDDLKTDLLMTWHDGMPDKIHIVHEHASVLTGYSLWDDLLHEEVGTPDWMLDVPAIAAWAVAVEKSLERCERSADARVSPVQSRSWAQAQTTTEPPLY
jgi:hypothetical protein